MSITIWRLVKARHAAGAFSGEGAALYGGRWNSVGQSAVYCSSSLALAALETLVHLQPPMLFSFSAFRAEIEESMLEKLPYPPMDWQQEPPTASCKQAGDAWLRSMRSAVLSVPSVVVPLERNYVLNPLHPDFKRIIIHPMQDFTFDPRLGPL
jgi:RES domain-containing protein